MHDVYEWMMSNPGYTFLGGVVLFIAIYAAMTPRDEGNRIDA